MTTYISDPFAIIQTAGETYVGVDVDEDTTYMITPALIQAGDMITIIDSEGNNTLQLTDGLGISSSIIANDEAVLYLTNGASVNIRGAASFSYDVGGNSVMGVEGDIKTFDEFVQQDLVAHVPGDSESPVTGGDVVIGESTASFGVSAASVSAYEGDMATFVIDLNNPETGQTYAVDYDLSAINGASSTDYGDIAIGGTSGAAASGTLIFAPGVTQATITVTLNEDTDTPETGEALEITLSDPTNSAVLRAGGDTTAVTILDTSEAPGYTEVDLAEQEGPVTAQDGTAEAFILDFSISGGVAYSSDVQVTINGFNPSEDILRFDDSAATPATEAEFLEATTPAVNGFDQLTTISFYAESPDVGSEIILAGILDASLGRDGGSAFFEVV